MKITFTQFWVIGFFTFCSPLLALDSGQVQTCSQRISNSDPAVRLAAMAGIGKLTERTPAKAGNEVVPLLAKGLTDSDAKVRAEAAADLAGIAMQTAPRFVQQKAGFPDLQSYSPLKADLEKAMFDPDPEVRRAAMGAYSLTFDLTPELQVKLIQEFPNEEKTSLQPAIIEMLTSCKSPTPATQVFLTQLLDDQKNRSFVVQSFANTPSSWNLLPPPTAALPKLADLLAKEKDTDKRQTLARAVGNYGLQARPYLGQIEHLRDKESDSATRSNLKAVADAIRAGKQVQDQ